MRLVAVAAAAVMGVAVLAGCSDGEQANETLPSTSLSGSAEPSETLQPLGPPDLPMPDEAREMTPAGAEAFIRYYMDVYNLAQESMNAQYLHEFSRGCDTCDRLANTIDEDVTAGYEYEGGEVSTDYSQAIVEKGRAELVFSITQRSLRVLGPDGQVLDGLTFAERRSPGCGAFLSWVDTTSSWVITQWDVN